MFRRSFASLAAAVSLVACVPPAPDGPDAGDTPDSGFPVLHKARARKVVVAVGYACAVTVDGSVRCWGLAASSGNGNEPPYYHFGSEALVGTIPVPVEVPGLRDVTDIDADYEHVCVTTAAKKALCWGRNDEGQVGNGTNQGVSSPYELPLADVKKVVTGNDHSCALLEDGTVKCWGSNFNDQLEGIAVALQADRWAPLSVPYVSGATDLFAAGNTTCAVMQGQPRCWGGLVPSAEGSLSTDAPPRAVALAAPSELVLTRFVACGLSGGAVKCWGSSDHGNLGTGAQFGDPEQVLPAPVRGLESGATSLTAGCATARGNAYCWGEFPRYLGDGSFDAEALVPVQVKGLTDAVQIASAFRATCAVTSAGAVHCWGEGAVVGSDDYYLTPQRVASFE